jgi:hypothetical protein
MVIPTQHYTTVGELIDILQRYDPGSVVVLARDAEGNRFSPIDCGEFGTTQEAYTPDTPYAGVIVDPDGVGSDAMPAVVLWPTN